MTARLINSGRKGGQRKAKRVADFQFLDSVPAAPAHFSDAMKDEWNRVCSMLVARNDLCEGDLNIVENFVIASVDYRELTLQIMDEGRTYQSQNGNLFPHPAVKIRRDAEMQMTVLSGLLGLNPKARNQQSKENGVMATEQPGSSLKTNAF